VNIFFENEKEIWMGGEQTTFAHAQTKIID
jgi:hypothetical protein